LKVGVVPEKDDEGNPNPDVGQLRGFDLDPLEDENLTYLYMRIPQVDAIRATLIQGDNPPPKPRDPRKGST
jgi:hypothetical protein